MRPSLRSPSAAAALLLLLAACGGAEEGPRPAHPVHYAPNGATSGAAPVDEGRYAEGAVVTVLGNTGQLAREGFAFGGWNTSADGAGEDRAPGSTFTMGAAEVTLHARWIPLPRHAVTYDGNGATAGAPPVDAGLYLEGAEVTVLGDTGGLARAGFAFGGWNTSADGAGEDRAPGSTFTMGAAEVTLHARWIPLPRYAISYDGNGATAGEPPTDDRAYLEGETAAVLGNTGALARAGFGFDGWSTAADGSGARLAPGAELVIGAADVTLYAVWRAAARAVACGESFSQTLLHDGTLRGVGHDYYFQLGAGPGTGGPSAPFTLQPVAAALPEGVRGVAVATGSAHTALVDTEGRLWVVGGNSGGQLGDGTWEAKASFTQVAPAGAAPFTAVFAAREMTFALDADGVVWVSGRAPVGEFGAAMQIGAFTALAVPGLGRVRAVAPGDDHTLLLDEGGDVWSSGYNDDGQLGDGTGVDRKGFVKVIATGDVAQIAAGYDHSLALRTDGTLWAAGDNWYGQLGLGTTSDSLSFVQVPFEGSVAAVAAGWGFTYVVDADGALWSAGDNTYGQLGDGTTEPRGTLVRVLDAGVVSAHAGAGCESGFVVSDDGAVRSAGRNQYGQLGDGTQEARAVFGPVLPWPEG